jgi:hypothetical protein
MTQQTFEFTYSVEEILKSLHALELNKVIPNPNVTNFPTNLIEQSYATLFYGIHEVGKIFYYSNFIALREQSVIRPLREYFENVIVKLEPSPCFELDTFLSGQLFYTNISSTFDNNKKLSFKSISAGGSFEDKNINVSIITDNTPIRKVIINVKDLKCKCDN